MYSDTAESVRWNTLHVVVCQSTDTTWLTKRIKAMDLNKQFDSLNLAAIKNLKDREIIKNGLELVRMEDNPENREFIQGIGGEDEWMAGTLGAGKTKQLLAALKRHDMQFNMWIPVVQKEGMSDKQKTFLETRAHGLVDTSVKYVMEDGQDRGTYYDGDMDVDPTKPASEQDKNTGFRIPYLRERTSYSIFTRGEDGKSQLVKEVAAGQPKEIGGYKVMQIYMAKQLPATKAEDYQLVQWKLNQLAETQQWDKLGYLAAMMRDYRKCAGQRQLQDKDNGTRRVYYKEYGNVVLFSPIVFDELSEGRQERVKAFWIAQKEGQALMELMPTLNGGEGFQEFKDRVKKLTALIREYQLWILWKSCVKPFQHLVFDLNDAKDINLFD